MSLHEPAVLTDSEMFHRCEARVRQMLSAAAYVGDASTVRYAHDSGGSTLVRYRFSAASTEGVPVPQVAHYLFQRQGLADLMLTTG